ncbi:putative F-box protein PP2-B12, partial [Ipomoea triloba]|uniref:putative F-box protein PP2-B12 n=1 Tax=Ipomoea triloba TaxID=35885 RepID=UPI00125E37AD
MEEHAWNNYENSDLKDRGADDEKSDKILEIDIWKPRQNPSGSNRTSQNSQYFSAWNDSGKMEQLPEDCISQIVSFTSPVDAAVYSVISKGFKASSESDVVWIKFLPSNIEDYISRSSSFIPVFPTKKALFLFLSNSPILLDGGKMSFSLDKKIGKKYFMVAPRVLTFTGVNDPIHFITVHEEISRFAEIGVLHLSENRRDICGRISCRMLSEEIQYTSYLVYKPVLFDSHFLLGTNVPRNRPDGWLEVEIESFFNVERNPNNLGEVESILFAMGDFSMYSNIIVQGIEFRPKPTEKEEEEEEEEE